MKYVRTHPEELLASFLVYLILGLKARKLSLKKMVIIKMFGENFESIMCVRTPTE
eukprot:UN07366